MDLLRAKIFIGAIQ